MKKCFLFLIVFLFPPIFSATDLHAGYSRDTWGSRTWTGPGRPPHWSPETTRPRRPHPPVPPGKPVGPGHGVRPPYHGVRPPHNGSGNHGGYWQDRHNRWHYHRHRRRGYVYYREPARVETVIIEREKRVPVYIPVPHRPAKQQCGGDTVTRKDPVTGDLTIEYVTGARDCP
jgi:hypothetical protein